MSHDNISIPSSLDMLQSPHLAHPNSDIKQNFSYVPSWMLTIRTQALTAWGSLPGKHRPTRSFLVMPTRILLITTLVSLALCWLGKQGCIQQTEVNGITGVITDGHRPFTAMCYTDLIVYFDKAQGYSMPFPFLPGAQLDPWIRHLSPLIQIWLYILINLTHLLYPILCWLHFPTSIPMVFFFGLSCTILSFLWICIIFMVRSLLPFPRESATILSYLAALSPIIMVQAFTNYDILPVFCSILGLWLLAQQKNIWSGVVLGLGTTASLSCGIIIVAIIFLWCKNSENNYISAALSALITFASALLIFALLNSQNLAGSVDNLLYTHEDLDSIYTSIQSIFNYTTFDDNDGTYVINMVVITLSVILLIGVAILIKISPTPTIYQTCLLLTVGFLVIGKACKPQYSIWVIPLAVLGCSHTKLITAWMIYDASSWFIRCAALLSQFDQYGLPLYVYGVFSLIRITFFISIMTVTAYDMLQADTHAPHTSHTPRDLPVFSSIT